MPNIYNLERLARNATPGKWVAIERYNEFEISTNTLSICEVLDFSAVDFHNAQFIAASDPTTVLELIERLREASRLLEYMHDTADSTNAYEHFSAEKLKDIRKWLTSEVEP